MATRGYNSYRGRVSTGRIVLIVVLVLILLGAIAYVSIVLMVCWKETHVAAPGKDYEAMLVLGPGDGMTAHPRRIRRRWRMWTSTGWNRRAN